MLFEPNAYFYAYVAGSLVLGPGYFVASLLWCRYKYCKGEMTWHAVRSRMEFVSILCLFAFLMWPVLAGLAIGALILNFTLTGISNLFQWFITRPCGTKEHLKTPMERVLDDIQYIANKEY